MYPANDNQFCTNWVKETTNKTLTTSDGWCIGLPEKLTCHILPGMEVRDYGRGLGYPVRGLFVNGHRIWYRTQKQEDERHKKWVANEDRKKQNEFKKNKGKIDKEVAALPKVFQVRLKRFRSANKYFRWQYEPYELFVCKEAVKIAAALKTKETLQTWTKLNYVEQKRQVPNLDDGHSGNTFSSACRLAYLYLTSPDNVVKEHGALVPLVGCDSYGCTH